jgi:hypothetical protein
VRTRWRDAKETLRVDPRWDAVRSLRTNDKEDLFRSHIEVLVEKRKTAFYQLMDSCAAIALTTTWEEVRPLVSDDPRFEKFSDDDKDREDAYVQYLKERKERSFTEFGELLVETKGITHVSWATINEDVRAGKCTHMNALIQALQLDKRYEELDGFPNERADALSLHLQERAAQGRGAPPTASSGNYTARA